MIYLTKNNKGLSIKELPQNQRPREMLASNGASKMSDEDLVCIILGNGNSAAGVKTIASDVLELLSKKRNEEIQIKELTAVKGLGVAQACRILACMELGKRFLPSSGRRFRTPEDIWHTIRHYGDRNQEHFLCIMLNGAYEIIEKKLITIGLVNRTLIHPREVFAAAVQNRAVAVILAHNHPSGNLEPSQDDCEATQKLKKAGAILGIEVLDHIIFSYDSYLSMQEQGLMF